MLALQALKNISFQDYKSYKNYKDSLIPSICDFNVIIGKNNTGKTSFLDIIEYLINPKIFLKNRQVELSVHFSVALDIPHMSQGFDRQLNGGGILGNHYAYGSRFVNSDIHLRLQGEKIFHEMPNDPWNDVAENWKAVAASYQGEWNGYCLLRLSAERDIRTETEDKILCLQSNGSGATNLIRGFINQKGFDEHLIEDLLLMHLNIIMGNDASFSRIQVQQNLTEEESTWEIFLEEKDAGRFALSQSGSGLKTIILVLLNLLIVPKLPENKDKTCIFAFEELENNLHPALQRRLFDYLYHCAVNKHTPIFLTTHSHVAIDMFCSRQNAQVLHVTKENHVSKIKRADSFFDKKAILDDLCVKASDLFQSNGIIWVEGPSDRIYINQWLKIFCDSKYKEGRDFQYLYYGGRLLAHYSVEELTNKINILTTNHNSAIIIDSDKRKKTDDINDTKKRIEGEFKQQKLFCWITAGKEIENYLPREAINEIAATPLNKKCGVFSSFPKYIKRVYPTFVNDKVGFAKKMAPHITVQNSGNILDLKQKVEDLYKQIEEWNSNK
ncbi:ATP-dependent nuclease [Candidatus Avelusimicrobium sp.]|uniref:ATP-dependent nuclease n=1 Tax=Candidatus Avelusimicrobium sp. TaxID=3048833 RepID=UPI003F80B37C